MAEDNFTLTTFYASWKEYQDRIMEALAPLTAEQLTLRVAPGLNSIVENATHMLGCRVGWYMRTMGEDPGAEPLMPPTWDELDAPAPTAAELVKAFDRTWHFMAACIARWTPADMQQTFPDDWDGVQVNLSRAWIVWHVIEHDLHHGGEVALTLGMHGLPSNFPG